jgi:hypothetical protein
MGDKNVQTFTLRKILAVSVLVALLLAMAPAAWSDTGGRERGEGPYGKMGHKIKSIEVPITVTGMMDNSTSFTFSAASIEGKKGKAAVVTFDKPLTGTYNMSSDMAFISTKGVDGMSVRVDAANNTTLPVAGASAVLGIGRIETEYRGKDLSISEFHKLSVHLPDGTVKAYDLEKPVKVIKSKERKTVVWDAYPGFTDALKGALSSGATFPADASPMKVSDLASAEMSSTPMHVEARMRSTPPTT